MNDAYTAGIIDGEGTITIANQDGYYYLRVNVTMSDKGYRVLDFLHREYGGMMGKERPSSGNTRASKQWRVSNGDAARVINSVLNHLRLKREQALVALQLWDLIEEAPKKSNGRTEWSNSMKASAEVLKRRIGELNARGVNGSEAQVVHEGAVAVWKYGEWHEPEDDLFGPVPFKGRLPVRGSMRNGVVYELPMSAHHMDASESLSSQPGGKLLPTATSADSNSSGGSNASNVTLTDAVVRTDLGKQENTRLLPSPVAQPSGNSPEDHLRKKPGRERVTDLAILVENDLIATGGKLLPTPMTSDGTGGAAGIRDGYTTQLRDVEQLLPTPKAGDADFGMPRTSGRPPEKSTHLMTRMEYTKPAESWGPYAAAIARWESVLGRPAPAPTEEGPKGGRRLSSLLVEWMMGLPEGWVTGHGLPRTAELKMLGNGVVPQQAIATLREMVA